MLHDIHFNEHFLNIISYLWYFYWPMLHMKPFNLIHFMIKQRIDFCDYSYREFKVFRNHPIFLSIFFLLLLLSSLLRILRHPTGLNSNPKKLIRRCHQKRLTLLHVCYISKLFNCHGTICNPLAFASMLVDR